MARIRTIKPQFFKNEDVALLPAMARLLFIGLWTLADRDGRLEDRPKRIKAEIFPYENFDAEKGLEDLERAGLIIRYKGKANASGRILSPEQPETELALIQIRTFKTHQRFTGKEAQEASIYSPPDNWEASGKQLGSKSETLGSNGEATGNPGMEYKEGSNGVDGREKSSPPILSGSVLKSVETLQAECMVDKLYFVENVKRQHRISEIQLEKALQAFTHHLLSVGDRVKSVKDYRTHFLNWLKKQDLKSFRIGSHPPSASSGNTLKELGL